MQACYVVAEGGLEPPISRVMSPAGTPLPHSASDLDGNRTRNDKRVKTSAATASGHQAILFNSCVLRTGFEPAISTVRGWRDNQLPPPEQVFFGEALESDLPTVSFRRIIVSRLFHRIPAVLTTPSKYSLPLLMLTPTRLLSLRLGAANS